MIYALIFAVICLFLTVFAVIAYTWTLKQGFDLRENAIRAENEKNNVKLTDTLTQFEAIRNRVVQLAERPEAPAIEQYKRVLGELEDFGHTIRTLEHRMDETLESVRRTQNKIASRSTREAKLKFDAQIEADYGPASLTQPEAANVLPRRQFGRVG